METNILVVDDDRGICSVVSRELKRQGYQVTTLCDPTEVAAMLNQRHFEIVISDMKMPVMSGLDVLELVKKKSPSSEIIIMTGYASIESTIECLRGGAFDFLDKPFVPGSILSSVRRALKKIRRNEAVLSAARGIVASLDLASVTRAIVCSARDAVQADVAMLLEPDQDDRIGLPQDAATTSALQIAIAHAVLERAPRLFAELPPSQPAHENDGASCIVYPIVSAQSGNADSRVMAALTLLRNQGGAPFENEDIEHASIFASMIQLALRKK